MLLVYRRLLPVTCLCLSPAFAVSLRTLCLSSPYLQSLSHSFTFLLPQVMAMGTGKDVIKFSLYSGLSFYLYNEASFLALERLSKSPFLVHSLSPSFYPCHPLSPYLVFSYATSAYSVSCYRAISFFIFRYHNILFLISYYHLLGPVTHSVANTLKRVVIIVASCIVFKSPMSLLGAYLSVLLLW
jgi:Triose-phosphate Transporter family